MPPSVCLIVGRTPRNNSDADAGLEHLLENSTIKSATNTQCEKIGPRRMYALGIERALDRSGRFASGLILDCRSDYDSVIGNARFNQLRLCHAGKIRSC